jgi:hypothetical protein
MPVDYTGSAVHHVGVVASGRRRLCTAEGEKEYGEPSAQAQKDAKSTDFPKFLQEFPLQLLG